MSYEITELDKTLVLQNILHLKVKLEVLDQDNHVINCIEGGLISGSSNCDAESDVRRTFSITIIPDVQTSVSIGEYKVIWLDKKVKLYIGIKNNLTDEYSWYPQGVYLFMSTSATYDATTNQIEISCSDMMSLLDGTRNGNLGQQTIEYDAYVNANDWVAGATYKVGAVVNYYATTETTVGEIYQCTTANTDTTWTPSHWKDICSAANGTVWSYNYIRDQLITAVTQLGYVTQYNIDWIGEAKAFPFYEKGWDWNKYRESTKIKGLDGNYYYQCFATPSDQVFESGTTVLNIVTTFRDLYENYEAYFDENGIFCCHQIPQGEDDPIIFDNSFLQKILVSEDTSLDFSEVKNVEEVWGKTFEPDWFQKENVTYSNNVYSMTIDKYTDSDHTTYYNGDEIAFIIPQTNAASPYMNVNNLGNIPIYDENYEKPIAAKTLTAGDIYSFKIKKRYDTTTSTSTIVAYLEGEWQVHTMDVLTDGTVGDDYTDTTSGHTTKKYSKEFFQDVYNCEDVHLTVIEDSPFTVQKLGVILEVYDNDDIQSTATGLETARQENYRNCRLTDNITITTKICPFADVNIKVSYKRSDADTESEYLVKSLSHDWSSGQTTWTLMKYYKLYVTEAEKGTYKDAQSYTYGYLSNFTHDRLGEGI